MFMTVIFCAPSVYSFSHGVDFFLDFFFGFSICYASFDRERLLMEVNSTYYVDVQKEEPTASCVSSVEGIYSNQEHRQHNRNSLESTVLSFCVRFSCLCKFRVVGTGTFRSASTVDF